MKYAYLIIYFGIIFSQDVPDSFNYIPTNLSGVFQGQITINGSPASGSDWVAAFDGDGNCAGASELVFDGGTSYINLPIYGDDGTTSDIDEGVNSGEEFYLRLWDSSSDLILEYPDGFDCWINTNGAPMGGCGGVENVYNFPSVDWIATLTASGGPDGSSYDLTFGFSPNATDGYDNNFDIYAPPSPPPPAFDTALNWGGDRYYRQILSGDGELSEHEYGVSFAFPSDNIINISWQNSGWGEMMSSCVLEDAFGGMMINVDMLSDTSLILDNPAFSTLNLKVTPNAYAVPSIDHPPEISYIPNQTIENGEAFTSFDLDDYLTEVDGDEVEWSFDMDGFVPTINISGGTRDYDLVFGFNFAATDEYDHGIDMYAPPPPPLPNMDAALGWGGERYYIQILGVDDGEHDLIVHLQYPEDGIIHFNWHSDGWGDLMSSCILQDAFGGEMINVDMLSDSSITLNNPALNTLYLKVAPNLGETQTRDLIVDVDDENIVTVSYSDGWIGHQMVMFTATDQTAEMLSDIAIVTFTVEELLSSYDNWIPDHVTLKQNIPNPFNIDTRILFSIDISGFVFLEILDFTGREVRTLVLNNLDPGDHSIIWKGENNQGSILSSGVYFYRLSHSQDSRARYITKKMVLIK